MAWAKRERGPGTIDLTASGMPDFLADDGTGLPLEGPFAGQIDVARLSRRSERVSVMREFREAVARRYGLEPENVVPTFGASQAIMHVCFALLRAGDHVIVERPTYEALHRVPELLGANVSRLERTFDEGWEVVPDRLARLLTPRTRAVILSSLHNPSGVAVHTDRLEAVAEMAARVGALLLVDEVYLDYAFDPEGGPGWRPACLAVENSVSWSSSTKAFGFGALRAGWIVTRNPDAASALRTAADYFAVDPPIAGYMIATQVLESAPKIMARTDARISAGRAVVEAWLAQESRVSWVPPSAGASGVLRLPKLVQDHAFVELLRDEHDVLVVPGSFFDAPGTVRLSFGGDPTQLQRGLDALSETLDQLSNANALNAAQGG